MHGCKENVQLFALVGYYRLLQDMYTMIFSPAKRTIQTDPKTLDETGDSEGSERTLATHPLETWSH